MTLEGSWKVAFQKDRGAPPQAIFENLSSWSENSDTGIRYFSGTATYTKTVEIKPEWVQKGTEQWLELGDVKNLAEVIINGRNLGIIWKKPFRVNMTSALKPGTNTLVIKVTNLWVNRLIGDQQTNGGKKYTFTTMPFYNAKSPLQPSGLLGPVRILGIH